MAVTTRLVLNNTWQLAVEDGSDFILENVSSGGVCVTFQTSTPASDAAYHNLLAGEVLMRMGLTGNVYLKDSDLDGFPTSVVITQ